MPNFFPDGMPLPAGDQETQPFWDYCKRHELRIQRCKRCGTYRHTPQACCYECQSFEYEWVQSQGLGEVYTFGIVHYPNHPALRETVPYNVVAVQLNDCGQVKLISNLVNWRNEEIYIGMLVELVWEDTTPEVTQYRFELRQRQE